MSKQMKKEQEEDVTRVDEQTVMPPELATAAEKGVVRAMEKPEAYSAFLTKCETLEQLRAHVLAYESLALDAVEIVHAMTVADFTEFRRGLKMERRGRFAGMEWAKRFAAVLMPEPMFTVTRIADEYKVPFMVAHRRLQEVRPDLLELHKAADAVDPDAGGSTT